jgi:hypothetical protein
MYIGREYFGFISEQFSNNPRIEWRSTPCALFCCGLEQRVGCNDGALPSALVWTRKFTFHRMPTVAVYTRKWAVRACVGMAALEQIWRLIWTVRTVLWDCSNVVAACMRHSLCKVAGLPGSRIVNLAVHRCGHVEHCRPYPISEESYPSRNRI